MNDNASPPTGPEPVSKEIHQVDIIKNGTPSEFCKDLTEVPDSTVFAAEGDLAWRLGVLGPLRDWLAGHGALTPGSGLLVRALSADVHPDDRAEELRNGGDVLDSWQVTVEFRRRAQSVPAPR